jgi:galactose mutarotase-like enzyme
VALEVVSLAHAEVAADVVPARGALLSSLRVGGAEVLFLDRATLEDPARNVRGGIPVLFPFAGRLANDAFLPAGTRMTQHGFGRRRPWSVRDARGHAVRLVLEQDDQTRAEYPYGYEADYGVELLPAGVQVELVVHNRGTRPLPLSPGWHPYFRCPAALKKEVRGDVPGLEPDRMSDDREFDFGLPAPVTGRARFRVPGLGALRLEFSPVMRHLQFWSLPGRDFVCLEPFLGPNDTINGDGRVDVPPGRAQDFWMRIELERE